MTCLLQLAVGARQMLRHKHYKFPEASEDLLTTFYPILLGFIMDVQMRDTAAPAGIFPPIHQFQIEILALILIEPGSF